MVTHGKWLVWFSVILYVAIGPYAYAQPDWARKQTTELRGNVLRMVCSGQGPSVDLARNEALDGCRSSAARQLQTDIKVKTLTVETERDVGLHQEIREDVQVANLRCQPEQEEIEGGDGAFVVWLKCRFDLSA